jgi:hypothetical protein
MARERGAAAHEVPADVRAIDERLGRRALLGSGILGTLALVSAIGRTASASRPAVTVYKSPG